MKKERPNKADRKTDSYTVTEVGTLLEEIRSNVKRVAEGHSGLDQRMEKLEVAVHGNSRRLDRVEMRLDVVVDKVDRIEDASLKLTKDLRETGKSLENKIEGVRQNLEGKIEGVRQNLEKKIEGAEKELKAEIHQLGDRLTAVETPR